MKSSTDRSRARPRLARKQQGAALYVALIMLILMAMIGIIGLQVTGMQERMAANYLRVNQAFQNAEATARGTEREIETRLFGAAGTYTADQETCAPIFDTVTWADGLTDPEGTYTRRIDRCFPSSSRRVGAKKNEETGNIYEVNALASDSDTGPSASAVISTVFIP